MTSNTITRNLVDVRIMLSALWVARMLTGFVGDVLKFYEPGMMEQILAGEVDGMPLNQGFRLAAAIIFVLPVFMVYLSLTLPYKANRWANIIVAILFVVYTLIGVRSYPSAYDRFLLFVSLVANVLSVWYAWNWVQ